MVDRREHLTTFPETWDKKFRLLFCFMLIALSHANIANQTVMSHRWVTLKSETNGGLFVFGGIAPFIRT
jgi:hypothetical protein